MPATEPIRQRSAFLQSIQPEQHFFLLFDQLEDVLFFAKDREGRLWAGNRALRQRYGLRSASDLWGKTDFDFLPTSMAAKFRSDDLKIMETGEPMLDIVELYPDEQGVPAWFLTHKRPILGLDGLVIGVMGTIHEYTTYRGLSVLLDISPALDYLRHHFSQDLKMTDVAPLAGLSLRQFERKFKEHMKTTPKQFLIKLRVHAACDRLRETADRISDVATDCGFYDQSSFTRQFQRHVGLTPLRYRRKYR